MALEETPIQCKFCIVDSIVHPQIILDDKGECDICKIVKIKLEGLDVLRENKYFEEKIKTIKSSGLKKGYDCMIGLSGGVDSAYLAIMAKKWGLTPLLVHIDTGWNSEMSVSNIKELVGRLGYDLYTEVIRWEEIKDVVNAFLKSSVIDIDMANEMAAQASLYKIATKFNQKYILTGHQISTEGWMPPTAVHYKLDLVNFKAIHKLFGKTKLNTYPTIGYLKTWYYKNIKRIEYVNPLDYVEYNKEKVLSFLIREYGWKDYGNKHYENVFTRFYQGHILPEKFHLDKRKFHYSALILSGQLTRDSALELVKLPAYPSSELLQHDMEFVSKKLGLSADEFNKIITSPPKRHTDYPSIVTLFNKIQIFKNVIKKIIGKA